MDENSHEASGVLFTKLLAIQAGVVALLRTSHAPGLNEVLEQEIEKSRAILLGSALGESAIEAFERQIHPLLRAVK